MVDKERMSEDEACDGVLSKSLRSIFGGANTTALGRLSKGLSCLKEEEQSLFGAYLGWLVRREVCCVRHLLA